MARLIELCLLIGILAAFVIGISVNEMEINQVDLIIDNSSKVIDNITLTYNQSNSSIPNMNGILKSIEYGVKFVGFLFIEVFRAGIHFGHDNPQYFKPEFILALVKFILIALIVGLLIKPVFYILVFLVLCGIWVRDYFKKRKEIQFKYKEVKNGRKQNNTANIGNMG